MTAEEFERAYAGRAGQTVEEIRKYRAVRPCDCDWEQCEGWQMLPHASAADYDAEHATTADVAEKEKP